MWLREHDNLKCSNDELRMMNYAGDGDMVLPILRWGEAGGKAGFLFDGVKIGW